MNEFEVSKQELMGKLGPNYENYIQLLGSWFRGLISKEEFDSKAKLLVEQNYVIEHNKFWLAFFHHCANNVSMPIPSSSLQSCDSSGTLLNKNNTLQSSDPASKQNVPDRALWSGNKVKSLPSRVLTQMKIYVLSWELGLDSVNDNVSRYIYLALDHFLKNIITELVCTKTAYRLRENRFVYAIGVKPINPYLNNSLKIYSSNLEHDPYQIESNKMNSSLVDTHAYNDSLFPSRLYEAQALYEYACSTTDVTPSPAKRQKTIEPVHTTGGDQRRRLTLSHLLMAFLSNPTMIQPKSLYSMNLERIFNKLEA